MKQRTAAAPPGGAAFRVGGEPGWIGRGRSSLLYPGVGGCRVRARRPAVADSADREQRKHRGEQVFQFARPGDGFDLERMDGEDRRADDGGEVVARDRTHDPPHQQHVGDVHEQAGGVEDPWVERNAAAAVPSRTSPACATIHQAVIVTGT